MQWKSPFSHISKLLPDWAWVVIGYLLLRLPFLTHLPVFADEAIYIRWAQLIQDDLPRYAFFSMADGKPPLFMWLLATVLKFFPDPLFAGRFLSVGLGLIQVFILRDLARMMIHPRRVIWTTVLALILPFWFFYERMALMDILLTLLLCIAWWSSLRLSLAIKEKQPPLLWAVVLAISFGLSLMTKTPALFMIPVIGLSALYPWVIVPTKRIDWVKIARTVMWLGAAGFAGGCLFLTLRLSPLFGALFARSTDFTFSFKEILNGEWHYVLFTSPLRNLTWLVAYMTPGILLLIVVALFTTRARRVLLYLLACAVLFALPLTLFGRVLYPRYFLPSAIFLTVAGGVAIRQLSLVRWGRWAAGCLLISMMLHSGYFIITNWTDLGTIPFVTIDRLQYLTEWSAGFGNLEVRDYVTARRNLLPPGNSKVIVLTEGSFGTLPDGLLMYFHSPALTNRIEVHGIGVKVQNIPAEYANMASSNEVYYMVNSHRFGIVHPDTLEKVLDVKRPDNGPSLMLYRVKPQ